MSVSRDLESFSFPKNREGDALTKGYFPLNVQKDNFSVFRDSPVSEASQKSSAQNNQIVNKPKKHIWSGIFCFSSPMSSEECLVEQDVCAGQSTREEGTRWKIHRNLN